MIMAKTEKNHKFYNDRCCCLPVCMDYNRVLL